jgi:hypothetical protein
VKDPRRRLGSKGINQIKNHPFLEGIDWELVEKKKIKPPFIPIVKDELDLSNISTQYLNYDVTNFGKEGKKLNILEKKDRQLSALTYLIDEHEMKSRRASQQN